MKTCSKCGENKPATVEYFGRNGKYFRGECKECHRNWHKYNYLTNKESIDLQNKVYYENNIEKVRHSRQKYYVDNRESYLLRCNEYREANREKLNEQKRAYSKTPAGRAAEANKYAKRKAWIKDKEITKEEWLSIMNDCDWSCSYCDCKLTDSNRTIDHFVPLCKGGDHCVTNITAACKPCNCSKQGFLYEEWQVN